MFNFKQSQIPLWVNIMQVLLTAIMVSQVFTYFFNHSAMEATGISVEGVPMLNLIYEMGARTLVIVAASIFVIVTQDPRQYLVVLLMNVVREGQETIIDPLFPIANAPMGPLADFGLHVGIVAIEVMALVVVWRIIKRTKT